MRVLGNKGLLDNKLAAVLNSSQSKTPCGNDTWITGSDKAVRSLIDRGYTIITSLYMNTWEMITYLASRNDGSQVVVSPKSGEDLGYNIFYKTIDQFRLDKDKTAMVFVKSEEDSQKPKSAWVKRDRAIFQMADLLVPVSIKPKGKLEKLLAESDKDIISEFKVDYAGALVKPPRYDFGKIVPPEIEWDYIVHWTRTHHGPWPDEKKYNFYERLINSGSGYTNNAPNTLKNIVAKKKIMASSEKIRKAIRCIGFSDLEPQAMLKWMRWLPKRVGWNFEPYGIGIKKSAAEKLGIRRVIYGDDELFDKLPDDDKPYFQSRGKKNVDWSAEHEWRKIGDLDLAEIAEDDLVLFVWKTSEAAELATATGLRIHAFLNE